MRVRGIKHILWVPGLLAVAGLCGLRMLPTSVSTAKAARGHAIQAVFATGTVEPISRIVVKARTPGILKDCSVQESDYVKKGDVLAHLEDHQSLFALQGSQAELAAAKLNAGDASPQLAGLKAMAAAVRAELGGARSELSRVSSLVNSGALPVQELERIRSRVAQLNAQVRANDEQQRAARLELKTNESRIQKRVHSLSDDVEHGEFQAPFDGVVIKRFVDPGQVIAPGEPIVELADTSRFVVQISINEVDVARVHGEERGGEGSSVAIRFQAMKDRVFGGHVERVSPELDRVRNGYWARVRLDEPPTELRSGMRAEANIVVGETEGAVLVPSAAVVDNGVWVVSQGRVVHRTVRLGMHDPVSAEIKEGLSLGDEVVLSAPGKLSDGSFVTATLRDQSGAPKPDSAFAAAGVRADRVAKNP